MARSFPSVNKHQLIRQQEHLSKLLPRVKQMGRRFAEIASRIPTCRCPGGWGIFRRNIVDFYRPKKLIAIEIGVEIDNEIDRVAGIDLECCHVERLLPIAQYGGSQHAMPRGDNPAADAIAS